MTERAARVAFAALVGCAAWLGGLGCGDDGFATCPPRANEGACARAADCPTGTVCGGEVGSLRCLPGGDAEPGAPCATAAACATELCLVGGTCTAPCEDDGDCGLGERCAARWVLGADAPVSACAARASLPPLTATEVERTGTARLSAAPANAHQVLLPHCGARPRPLRLVGAETLFDVTALAPGAPAPVAAFYAPYPDSMTVVLPGGPAYLDWDRDHSVVFEDTASFEHLVFAPGIGDQLPIDLFLVGVPGPTDAVLDPLRTALTSAGLALGAVRIHGVEGSLAERLAVLDGERGELPELGELYGLGAGLPPGLPIFLVRHLDYFLGLSGGIPIPLGTPGASGAGVVIGAEDAGAALGLVLAHEVGHALGLYHLIEADGSTREPLPGTPRCTIDTNADGLLDAEECASAGSGNLMFWSLDRASPTLEDEQAEVVRTAPILR